MVKGWADHCSSDEEDFHDEIHEDSSSHVKDENHLNDTHQEGDIHGDEPHAGGAEEQHSKPQRTYEFPTEPPFTAYVGNLAFNIDHPDRLGDEITGLAREVLNLDIQVLDARIAMDKRGEGKPRHRGFGYVQVATVDQLRGLMQLNELDRGMVQLSGRPIQVDTANHRSNSHHHHGGGGHGGYHHRQGGRRSSGGVGGGGGEGSSSFRRHSEGSGNFQIDGTKFRGGKHNNNQNRRASTNSQGGGGGGGRRESYNNNRDSYGFHNNNDGGGGGGEQGGSGGGGPPAQRPSLKLKPRSAPRDEDAGGGNLSSSASNIFGSGRARDEATWQSRRKSEQEQQQQHDRKSSRGDRRGSRAGRGSGRDHAKQQQQQQHGGRGGGGGHHHRNKAEGASGENKRHEKKNATNDQQQEEEAAPQVVPTPVDPPKPEPTKVSNKFAALGLSDSDSD